MDVRLQIDCNNHEDGSFNGSFAMVELYVRPPEEVAWTHVLSLEGDVFHGDVVQIYDQTATLAELEIAHEGHDKWVGNWCWDDLLVSEEDALRLLEHLRQLGHWQVTEAPESIFDGWEGDEPFDMDDLTEGEH